MQQQQVMSIFRIVVLALVLFATIGWALDQQQTSGDAKNQPQASNDAKPAQSTGAATAQPGGPAQVPTFRSSTDLVLVPVIVHDHSGAHVKGLSKDDFTVEENGAPQKISIFEEVTTAAETHIKRAQLAPGVYTNTMQTNSALAPRINIVVLDTINTAFADQAQARRQLIDFLAKSVQRNETTALLSLSRGGLKVVHDFTTDPKVLIAAINRVRGQTDAMAGENTDALISGADASTDSPAASGDVDAIRDFLEAREARVAQQFAIQATIDGFAAIADAFRGLPGRKALIWVTGSFPFQMTSPNDPPMARDFNEELWRAFQSLNDANVAVYPIDARGLVVALPDASTRVSARNLRTLTTARLNNQTATIETMQSFAEATGGRAFYNTNDLEKAFERASDDSSSYYLLGYYRAPDDNKSGWRKLKVKIGKSGLSLRTRSGYFVNTKQKDTPTGPNSDIALAVRAPMDFTGVPLAIQWEPASSAAKDANAKVDPGKKQAVFNLVIARNGLLVDFSDRNHVQFELVAVARTATGETAATFSQTIDAHPTPETLAKLQQGGITYRNQLQLTPGEYSVRFVVRDVLGNRVGSVLAPLKVE